MLNQPAFGGILHQLVSLGALEFRPEPLDALIERRLKHAWQQAPCPDCGDRAVQTSEDSPRIWCGNCRYTGTYTLRTPFYNSELTAGEFLIAFVLYADALLSINQIAPLLDHAYNTVYNGIRRMEAAFERGFPTVWERIGHTIDGPTQVDETQQYARDLKDKIHRGKGCPAADHRRVVAPDGRGNRATN
jgi:transposase-like protein